MRRIRLKSAEAARLRNGLVRDDVDDGCLVEKRRLWELASARIETPVGVAVQNVALGGVDCLLLTPEHHEAPLDLIVYLHGGGLVEGSAETFRVWCARVAKATVAAVLVVDYRLAPENPYPAAQNDTIRVMQVIQSDVRFKRVVSIGADSSGALLALQALVHLRDKSQRLPMSAFLLSPSLDLTLCGQSIQENADVDPLVSERVLAHYATLYAGDTGHSLAAISPLFADLSALPPMLVHVDDGEILLDDARSLCSRLIQQGCVAEIVLGRGLWHTWPCWGEFPESEEALGQIAEHVRFWARASGV